MNSKKLGVLLTAILTGGLIHAGLSPAALVVYTNRAAWEADIGSFGTETFATAGLGPLDPGANFYNFFVASIDANTSGFTAIVEPGAVNGTREFRARISSSQPADPSSINVQPFGLINGIGADFVGTIDGDRLTVTVLGDTVEFDNYLAGSGDGFFGVISDTPFSQLVLGTENPTAAGEAFSLDNVSFGPFAIPEPCCAVLLAALCFGAFTMRHRRAKT